MTLPWQQLDFNDMVEVPVVESIDGDAFSYVQTVPAWTWIAAHPFEAPPSQLVVTQDGEPVEVTVEANSKFIRAQFSAPASGRLEFV